MAMIYVGGCARALCLRKTKEAGQGDPGILAASGLVAGEGLAGVVIAVLVGAQLLPRSASPRLAGSVGEIAVLAALALVCGFLYLAGRSQRAGGQEVRPTL